MAVSVALFGSARSVMGFWAAAFRAGRMMQQLRRRVYRGQSAIGDSCWSLTALCGVIGFGVNESTTRELHSRHTENAGKGSRFINVFVDERRECGMMGMMGCV